MSAENEFPAMLNHDNDGDAIIYQKDGHWGTMIGAKCAVFRQFSQILCRPRD
jgi:hypothetical protein